jgi:hypothetical protein
VRPTLTCVEGVGMHRHSARLIRFAGGALVATVIAPWLGGAIAQAADASTDSNCDTQPPSVPSGYSCLILDEPTGQNPDLEGETWFLRDSSNHLNLYIFPVAALDQGDSVQVCARDTMPYDPVNNGQVDKCSGAAPDRVYVGSDVTLDLDLATFADPAKTAYFVVHVNQGGMTTTSQGSGAGQTPEVTPASGTVTGDCDNATVHMDGGSEGATFEINPAGTGSVIDEDFGSGATKTDIVPVDADHPTVTLTIDGELPGGSFTREASCDQVVEPVTDPAVSFANACTTGISVTLTNMQVDDTTTDPVTFTVVTPSGNTRQVTVRADQIVKLAFKVKEDTTGTVTVSAPGLTKTAHSYAKNCTKVLGEKVVKTPKTPKPAVQGEQAQLPFTGMPTALAAALGGLLLAVGGGLSVLGRRREREVSAS